jgi:hypothetical protein
MSSTVFSAGIVEKSATISKKVVVFGAVLIATATGAGIAISGNAAKAEAARVVKLEKAHKAEFQTLNKLVSDLTSNGFVAKGMTQEKLDAVASKIDVAGKDKEFTYDEVASLKAKLETAKQVFSVQSQINALFSTPVLDGETLNDKAIAKVDVAKAKATIDLATVKSSNVKALYEKAVNQYNVQFDTTKVATDSVKALEDGQTRENLAKAKAELDKVVNPETKKALEARYVAVENAIVAREEQEKAEAEKQAKEAEEARIAAEKAEEAQRARVQQQAAQQAPKASMAVTGSTQAPAQQAPVAQAPAQQAPASNGMLYKYTITNASGAVLAWQGGFTSYAMAEMAANMNFASISQSDPTAMKSISSYAG